MNQRQKKRLREQLETLALRLDGNVSSLKDAALRSSGGDASGNLSNAPVHLADLASDNFEQEMAVGLLQNQEQVLRQIAAALERLDAGKFGTCERCGKRIPAQRLEAIPYASRCAACEGKAEAEEGAEPSPDEE
jgi:RNA polymerase-binding transcription factor DksA